MKKRFLAFGIFLSFSNSINLFIFFPKITDILPDHLLCAELCVQHICLLYPLTPHAIPTKQACSPSPLLQMRKRDTQELTNLTKGFRKDIHLKLIPQAHYLA